MGRRMNLARVLSTVVLAMLAPGIAWAGVACPGYENMMFCGELNGDCKVTSTDALVALRIGVGQLPTRPEADVDTSGAVTSSDALRILRMGVGNLPASNSCSFQRALLATASGFYLHKGGHTANNYAVGWYTGNDDEVRDYFVFDLSPVPRPFASAMLHVSAGPPNQSLYSSPDPTETFKLFSVTSEIDTVKGGAGGVPVFTDLGDGTVYAEYLATSAIPKLVDIPLNAAGLQYVNNADSRVIFGGAITTLQKGEFSERLFNSTGLTSTRELIVLVE